MPKGVYQRRPRQKKEYAAALVAQVARLYRNGMTQIEVALATGITQKVVWRLMAYHGLKARSAVMRIPRFGSENHAWKGDQAGYQAFHLRLYALRGAPQKCERCGTTDIRRTYDWANLTGRYADPDDYQRMCRHCHRRYDDGRRGGAVGLRTDVTTEKVTALRMEGHSINDIAKRLGTSWPTVRARLA